MEENKEGRGKWFATVADESWCLYAGNLMTWKSDDVVSWWVVYSLPLAVGDACSLGL